MVYKANWPLHMATTYSDETKVKWIFIILTKSIFVNTPVRTSATFFIFSQEILLITPGLNRKFIQ